ADQGAPRAAAGSGGRQLSAALARARAAPHGASARARVSRRGPAVKDYLNAETTIWSWLSTTDHKRIGLWFLALTAFALLLGGVFAMLIRIEHLTPGRTVMDPLMYNRMFTLHGVIMVWFFMIPAIPSGFGNFLVPIMLGARDVA